MLGRIVRFGVVGGGMTLLNYALFVSAIGLRAPYLLAATLGWLVTVTVGYGLNRRFTFGREGWGGPSDLLRYMAGYVLQFLVSLAGLQVLMGVLRLGPSLAFVANLALTSSVSFVYLQLAVFRTSRCADPPDFLPRPAA